MRKFHLLLAAFLLVAGFAQGSTPKEKLTFFLPIASAQPDEGAPWTLYVETDILNGNFLKDDVKIFQRYSEETTPDPVEIGVAEYKGFDAGTLVFTYHPEGGEMAPREGDLVEVSIEMQRPAYRSIFFPLAQHYIQLNSVTDDLIVDFYSVLENDSPGMEEFWLNQLKEDARFTGKEMRTQMDPYPIKGGIFDGQELLDVLEKTEVKTIREFLRYMAARPKKYMGNTWKFSEIFATWITSETPMISEVEGVAFPENLSGSDFDARVKGLTPAELESVTERWNAEAEELASAEKHEEAMKKIHMSLKASEVYGSRLRQGWAWFSMGNVARKNKNSDRKVAENSYARALKLFSAEKQPLLVAFTQFNTGLLKYSQEDYSAARSFFGKAVDGFWKMKSQYEESGDKLNEQLAEALYFMGDTWLKEKKYKKAMNLLYEAGDLTDLHTREMARIAALVNLSLAEVMDALGQPEDAQGFREEGMTIYNEYLNWKEI